MIVFFGFLMVLITTLLIYAAYLLFFAFTLWMMVDAAKQDRFWWVLLILGVPFVGSIVYYLTEKKHEYAKAPSHHIHTSETEAQHEASPHPHKHHHVADDVHHADKTGEQTEEKQG